MVVASKYVRIIWNPNLVTFSCIGILYGYQLWYLNFVLWRGRVSINNSWQIYQGRQSSCHLGFKSKILPRSDLNPKWSGTLPSLIYFSWDIYRDPPSIEQNQISKLIFDTLLWEFLTTWGWNQRYCPGL
jgi:hypothetical protein